MTNTPVNIRTSSVREIAAKIGVSPATVHRFRTGHNVDLQTAVKMLPALENCPCCGRSTRTDTATPAPANPLPDPRTEAAEGAQRLPEDTRQHRKGNT